jgi:hypothetical protein
MIKIVSSTRAWDCIQPLVEAYTKKGISVSWEKMDANNYNLFLLTELAENSDALLVIGDYKRSPKNMVAGPFIKKKNGDCVPVGYLPERNDDSLQIFAKTAALVHQANSSQQSVAILSQRQSKFIHLADRVQTLLNEHEIPNFKWTSDLLVKEDMLLGLGSGLGIALYFGHGRPIGWVGYYGTRKQHFQNWKGQPLGALLNLCCATGSRKRVGLSFAEAIPLQGAAASSFGAVTDTLHTDNTRWAVRICKALENGVNTIGELIVQAQPPTASSVESYRIFGDPIAPILSTNKAITLANKIKVYP